MRNRQRERECTQSREHRSLLALCIVLKALISVPVSAAAQNDPSKTQAKALVQEGAKLFDRGDFAGALARFDEAYAKFPNAIIQFNRAQALRSLGRIVEASDAVERFLKEAIDAPVERLREGQQLLQDLQKQLAFLVVSSNVDGAEVLLDGTQIGTTPLTKAVPVKPGSHQVTVQKAGMTSFGRSVDLASGGRLSVEARLAAAAHENASEKTPAGKVAAPPPDSSPKAAGRTNTDTASRDSLTEGSTETGGHLRTWGFVVSGLGIVGVAMGGYYGAMTLSRNNQAEGICPGATGECPTGTTNEDVTRHTNLVADANKYQTRAIVGFVVGGAVLLGGLALVLTNPADERGSSPRVTASAGPGVATVGFTWRW